MHPFTIAFMTLFMASAVAAEEPAAPQTPPPIGETTQTSDEVRKIEEQTKQIKESTAKLEEAKNKMDEAQKELDKARGRISDGSQFAEFGFGLGFGNIFLSGDGDVETAVVDNGTIRITEQNENKLGVWLTTSWVHDSEPSDYINFGPFVGVQLGGNDNIVDSFSVGVDFSFRRIAPELPLDFQIGWAWTRVDELASGYADGAAPPEGASQVLLRRGTDDGPVLIVSYNFGRAGKTK